MTDAWYLKSAAIKSSGSFPCPYILVNTVSSLNSFAFLCCRSFVATSIKCLSPLESRSLSKKGKRLAMERHADVMKSADLHVSAHSSFLVLNVSS